ncbi:hypothetical protein ACLESD_17820 [Pyxidicoccus sp. 3LFB2]
MKMMAGILVALTMTLTACDTTPVAEQALENEAVSSEPHERTQEFAAVQGDCSVSIYCGNWASCTGSNGACSVNPAGFGSVTCTNSSGTPTTTYCNPIVQPTCGCARDGCCSLCVGDPDCGVCVAGKSCTADNQCGGGLNGKCNAVTKKCSCLVGG